jgi:FkbM family methyltransferase
MLAFLKSIPRIIIKTKRVNYSFGKKLDIFITLLKLHFKLQFNKNQNEVTANLFGYKFTTYGYKSMLFQFEEVFMSREYLFKTDKNNPSIIDCGANIGFAAIYFNYLFPACTVIAFEPNPESYYLLQKNIEQNNLTNVKVYNYALSNENGTIEFFIGNQKGSLHASIFNNRGGERSISIDTKKLSDFIGNSKFDLLKMDIEGAEDNVLDDLVTSGKLNQIDQYIIEYHHKINGRTSQMSAFLRPFEHKSFEYNIMASFGKLGVFQDIIIKAYKKIF